jgi:hypothetical protein
MLSILLTLDISTYLCPLVSLIRWMQT